MRAIVCTLLALGLLWDRVRAQNTLRALKLAAEAWEHELPCGKWDCECTFKRQRGCCCAAPELSELEDEMFLKMMDLYSRTSQLSHSVFETIGTTRVAFTAFLGASTMCVGPFVRNTTIRYDVITLNQGEGYKPALGVFTAPCSGLYSFTFSVYSQVGVAGERMYYKVQLMQNGNVVASTWEDNREDSEDSSTQAVLLSLQRGDQVYVELRTGRQLCGNVEGLNIFSGYLAYPTLA